jgi:hypothetical protein
MNLFTSQVVRLSTLCLLILLISCSSKNENAKEEQINIKDQVKSEVADSTSINSIKGNLSLKQISTVPVNVILTGLMEHRLVTIYKSKAVKGKKDTYSYSRSYDESGESETQEHFMPGIDLVYGYNLLNVAHYDLTTQKLNLLFDHPVLIKSLYYPSYVQDSINKKPINRNYYLVSVYDTDTNVDTLLNKNDLRHLYYFNSNCKEKIQLIPSAYSVVRSKYDPMNDVAYVFARHDVNGNGKIEKEEPLHIFWFSLKQPAEAIRLY